MKPRVLIGSAQETLKIARALGENLEHDAEVTVWEHAFGLTRHPLDELPRATRKCDFAIFVFGGEDCIQIRDYAHASTRDNVIFEFGLFAGYMGVERTIFVTPHDVADLRFPSDLAGVTHATFEANRQDEDLRRALAPTCEKVRRHIKEHFVERRSLEERLYTIIGLYDKPAVDLDHSCFQSFHHDGEHNINSIANLWSDSRPGNSIRANIVPAPGRKCGLRVAFEFAAPCYPPALGIRPEGLVARKVPLSCNKLSFRAKDVSSTQEEARPSRALAVRLVNGNVEHWGYSKPGGEQEIFKLPQGKWRDIDLKVRDVHRWQILRGAGNHVFAPEARFEILSSVILEFGCTGSRDLAPGNGTIDLFNFHFE